MLRFSLCVMEAEGARRYALISCWNKYGLDDLALYLIDLGYHIISTGGTYRHLLDCLSSQVGEKLHQVSDITRFPEILDGRVKTLHPMIHGGLLADRTNDVHNDQMTKLCIPNIEIVVANLYPFWEVNDNTTPDEATELIDIGGVALIRAAAKNHKNVVVISSPGQYNAFRNTSVLTNEYRRSLAAAAFAQTARYDIMIQQYMSENDTVLRQYDLVNPLKYGCNPHQTPAGLYSINGRPLPFELLNGDWGFINVLDAIGCWGLARELNQLTGRVGACSFKHTSPAGAAVAVPWDELPRNVQRLLGKLYNIGEYSSDAVNAYIRARNADPQSSFGDFIGISVQVDADLARVIKSQISDGIVAPSYSPEALEILKQKKSGRYVIIKADPDFVPDLGHEFREMFGFAMAQPRNTMTITPEDLANVVTYPKTARVPEHASLDLVVANAALKYAQSNNVACAAAGQVIGLSAGQQSRIHSVKLATQKARVWLNRHHDAAISLLDQFKNDVKRQAKINVTTALAESADFDRFLKHHEHQFDGDRIDTVYTLLRYFATDANSGSSARLPLSLASDAFFPFNDSIHEAATIGVKYISQPGGSNRDDEVIQTCNVHKITMAFTRKRIFTH